MKRIAGLPAAPPALARFQTNAAVDTTWDALRDDPAYQELRSALTERQHGLCAYCEIDLLPDDTSIEHVVPRSDPTHGGKLACDHGNMLAICRGGSNVPVYGPEVLRPDPARVLPPVDKNLSCGQAKGNRPASEFLDPRQVPDAPSLVDVDSDGRLVSTAIACATHNVVQKTVDDHIERLKLNVERLRIRRQAIMAGLEEAFAAFAVLSPEDRDQGLTSFAEHHLLPNNDGRLRPFFTTARSFFGPLAEAILARPPQAWI
jgi:uncharacterized protein (TIGR02646 family)